MGANGVFEEKHVVSRTHVVPCLDRFFYFWLIMLSLEERKDAGMGCENPMTKPMPDQAESFKSFDVRGVAAGATNPSSELFHCFFWH